MRARASKLMLFSTALFSMHTLYLYQVVLLFYMHASGSSEKPAEIVLQGGILESVVRERPSLTHSLTITFQGFILASLVRERPYQPPFTTFDDIVEKIANHDLVFNLQHPDYTFSMELRDTDNDNRSELMGKLRWALQVNPPLYLEIADSAEVEQVNAVEKIRNHLVFF